MNYLCLYSLTALVFFGIDLFWLGIVAKNLYAKQMGDLLATQTNWLAAIAFYLLYIVGILVFAVLPAYEKQSVLSAIFLGGFFGMVAYATYNLTNLAVIKNWPLALTFIDITWGIFLTASVATSGYFIANWILK